MLMMLIDAYGGNYAGTLRLVADAQGIPLEKVCVSLSFSRVMPENAFGMLSTPGVHEVKKIEKIEQVVELHGPNLTPEHRQRLLTAAEHCPVHGTLTKPPVIITTLAASGTDS